MVRRRLIVWRIAWIVPAAVSGCSIAPPDAQIRRVDSLVDSRIGRSFDAGSLLRDSDSEEPPPVGELTLPEATERALRRNLSLIASAENLTIAHGQLVQAGLLPNPTLGQSSGWLFPLSPARGFPSIDGNITEALSGILTQPARVSTARVMELQADIDFASTAFALASQVDAKYQEMVHLVRARRLAERITALYLRAVRAAEARSRVGVIPTPELNRARLSYEDSRRQVNHLAAQYARAAGEMNWLMGDSTPPQWHLPDAVLKDVADPPGSLDPANLESLALKFRLDLLRADFDRALGRRGVELARVGMIPAITPGFEVARDSSKNVFGGPFFSFTLPVFDPGLIALQIAEAQSRKADKTYAALLGQVRQDVRTALADWRIAEDDVRFYQRSLIPEQEQNVRLMETSFKLGNDDLDTLLNVYQSYVQQLQAYEDALQARHDSAIAVQQAVGVAWDRILSLFGTATGPASQPTTDAIEPDDINIPIPTTEPTATSRPTTEQSQ